MPRKFGAVRYMTYFLHLNCSCTDYMNSTFRASEICENRLHNNNIITIVHITCTQLSANFLFVLARVHNKCGSAVIPALVLFLPSNYTHILAHWEVLKEMR